MLPSEICFPVAGTRNFESLINGSWASRERLLPGEEDEVLKEDAETGISRRVEHFVLERGQRSPEERCGRGWVGIGVLGGRRSGGFG